MTPRLPHPARPALVALAAAAALFSRPARVCAQRLEGAPAPHAWFDLDLEFGAALRASDGAWFWHPRVRAGGTLVRGWQFWNVALTGETLGASRLALGAMVDVDDIATGLSVYAGANVSQRATPGATLGVGWSVVTLEAQLLFDAPTQLVVLAGLRAPLGEIFYALFAPRRPFVARALSVRARRPPRS